MRKLSASAFLLAASTLALACTEAKSKDGADGGNSESGGSSGGGAGGRDGSGGSEADGSPGGDGGKSPTDGGSTVDGASGGAGGRSSGGAGGRSSGGTGGRSSGNGGSPGTGGTAAGALPASTFLYVYAQTPDHDILVARDVQSGEERAVTDLTGDGSEGWEIWGASIAPDRKRIAIASLYAPTKADNDTGLATRRIFTLSPDGTDFERLTPVFPNTGGGRTNFSIQVDRPAYTQDGRDIIYNFGNYWWEGTSLKGGSFPWTVSAAGDALPSLFETVASCSVLHPAVNPATGDVLLIHSVCVRGADNGLYLYPKAGGTAPVKLVQQGYGQGNLDPTLTPASWLGDGSGFVFVASTEVDINGSLRDVSSLLVYDMTSGDITPLITPAPEERIQAAAIAPDASAIVYCLRHGSDLTDLHLVDLTTDPATDSPMTTDGKSCYPTF